MGAQGVPGGRTAGSAAVAGLGGSNSTSNNGNSGLGMALGIAAVVASGGHATCESGAEGSRLLSMSATPVRGARKGNESLPQPTAAGTGSDADSLSVSSGNPGAPSSAFSQLDDIISRFSSDPQVLPELLQPSSAAAAAAAAAAVAANAQAQAHAQAVTTAKGKGETSAAVKVAPTKTGESQETQASASTSVAAEKEENQNQKPNENGQAKGSRKRKREEEAKEVCDNAAKPAANGHGKAEEKQQPTEAGKAKGGTDKRLAFAEAFSSASKVDEWLRKIHGR